MRRRLRLAGWPSSCVAVVKSSLSSGIAVETGAIAGSESWYSDRVIDKCFKKASQSEGDQATPGGARKGRCERRAGLRKGRSRSK